MKKSLYGIHSFVALAMIVPDYPCTPKEVRVLISTFAKKKENRWYRAPAAKGIDRVLRVLTQAKILNHDRKNHTYTLTPYGEKLRRSFF